MGKNISTMPRLDKAIVDVTGQQRWQTTLTGWGGVEISPFFFPRYPVPPYRPYRHRKPFSLLEENTRGLKLPPPSCQDNNTFPSKTCDSFTPKGTFTSPLLRLLVQNIFSARNYSQFPRRNIYVCPNNTIPSRQQLSSCVFPPYTPEGCIQASLPVTTPVYQVNIFFPCIPVKS